MTAWSPEELAILATGDELQLASHRPDGTLRPFVRIWFVEVDGSLYVRSAYGPENGWYRRAKASGTGAIKVRGWQRLVAFETPEDDVTGAVTAAYRAAYDRYPPKIAATVVSADAEASTLRLVPG
jgi:hypothetical protein